MKYARLIRLIVVAAVVLTLVPLWSAGRAAAQAPYAYLPTPVQELNDGKFLVICSSSGYKTLSLEPISVWITSSDPQLEWGIFDPDVGGFWDPGRTNKGYTFYRLYADGDRTGVANPANLVRTWDSRDLTAYDNAWYSIPPMNQAPAALNGHGDYVYLLMISQEDPAAVSKEHFKLQARGLIVLVPGRVFAVEGYSQWTTPNAIYDGEWTYNINVTNPAGQEVQQLHVWDGDLDYGDIGKYPGAAAEDTDDLDTGDTKPPFATSPDTVPQGAQGAGAPWENFANYPAYVRGGPVTYELVDPNGNRYLNSNPSGNQEWEQFLIMRNDIAGGCVQGGPPPTGADYCVDSIAQGLWTVQVHGLDLHNLSFFNFDFDSVGAFSVAALNGWVYEDSNINGFFDRDTEFGLANVKVTLTGFDLLGNAVTLVDHTSPLGYYEFAPLLPGTYQAVETNPPGYVSVASNPGSTGGTASDADTLVKIPLGAGETSAENNFGDIYSGGGGGTGTPGYWKNHPDAWPVQSITIGGVTYTKAQAIQWLSSPVSNEKADKTITMFKALVAAKLNVYMGNNTSCIMATIWAADAWMAKYGPVGSKVKASSAAWKEGEPLYLTLDAYNNGLLCAPHRN